jgi:predicted nucleic acid-binding protein
MIYFDTAYLVKCYVNEPGAEAVRGLAAADGRIACCTYGRAELAAAVQRKHRDGLLSEAQRATVFAQIRHDDGRGVILWLPLPQTLLDRVFDAFACLPAELPVRTGAAIHLACAAANGFDTIYSSDRHLLAAAPWFGVAGRDILSPA